MTDLKMDQQAIFPSSGPCCSQQSHYSDLLWFNIIVPAVQTNINEEPNTRCVRHIWRQEWQAPSASHPNRLDTNTDLWNVTKFCIVCCAKYKETRTKFKCPECNAGLCGRPYFKVYHTKLHFWGTIKTKLEEWRTHKQTWPL